MGDVYCYVKNGKVEEGPRHLPKSWGNTSGLRHADDALLKKLGWLPFEEVKVAHNQQTHRRDGSSIDIQADKVVYTDTLYAYTVAEIKQNKWNDWMSDMYMADNHENMRGDGINRIEEDLMDALESVDSTTFDDEKYNKLKKRRADKRTLRAKIPPKP